MRFIAFNAGERSTVSHSGLCIGEHLFDGVQDRFRFDTSLNSASTNRRLKILSRAKSTPISLHYTVVDSCGAGVNYDASRSNSLSSATATVCMNGDVEGVICRHELPLQHRKYQEQRRIHRALIRGMASSIYIKIKA